MAAESSPAAAVDPLHDGVITVGVFTHNHERFVDECVDSISGDRGLRVILIDDASSDSTPERLRACADRLRAAGHVVELRLDDVNRGFVHRLNAFLEEVESEFFCLLSGDDRFAPGGLSQMRYAAAAHPTASVIFSGYHRIDAEGKRLPELPEMARSFERRRAYADTPRPAFDELLSHGSFVSGGCTLVRTEIIRRTGARFDPRLRNAEDYDFWLELGPTCLYLFVDDRPWDYRVLATSKYHAAGDERLRSELLAIGRHRAGAPMRVRALSAVQAAHRAKRQWVRRGTLKVTFAQTADLVQAPRWYLGAATAVAFLQGATRRLRRL